jgi:hypothetical protein
MIKVTYTRRWDRWWLKEANFNVLRVCLYTTYSWTTNNLWVWIVEETLCISSITLYLSA